MENNCVTCGHGSHQHRWPNTVHDEHCGHWGCGCQKMVYPKHKDEPRSSPQAAPGLREAMVLAVNMALMSEQFNEPMYSNNIQRIVDICVSTAADITAAQGGQVVDRDTAVCPQCGYDASKWVTWGRIKVDIENETETFERCPDTDSAVPSAPGGERVSKAWHRFITRFNVTGFDDVVAREAADVERAIAALGTPQGSDSLSYSDLNLILISLLDSSSNRDSVNEYQVKLFNRQHEVADKIEAIMKSVNPKPAQPVAAGEAKERGDNE